MTGALGIIAHAKKLGRITADDFRVLADIAPRFVDALKDGMGMTARELLQLAARGELTVHVVERALA